MRTVDQDGRQDLSANEHCSSWLFHRNHLISQPVSTCLTYICISKRTVNNGRRMKVRRTVSAPIVQKLEFKYFACIHGSFFSLSVRLALFPSLSLSQSLSLCACLSIPLSLFLPFSLSHTHTHIYTHACTHTHTTHTQ